MARKCKTLEVGEYKFIDFSDILSDIRDSFLDDLCEFSVELPMNVNTRMNKSYVRHSTLEEVLKAYIYVDISKINAIIIPKDISVYSGGLFITDDLFLENVLRTIDSSKRRIPLLIKRLDCSFYDIPEFLTTGEGIQFLMQVDCDKEKLKEEVVSFSEFKKFARANKLKYILENLIDKIEFKRLFMS